MMRDERTDYAYLRLSMEDGDVKDGDLQESCSIISQRVCIRQFLDSRPDLGSNLKELVDDGYSGTNMNRPGVQELLRQVEAGKVRTIIVRDLSRFARNYLEAGHYLEFIFPAYDVRFISINDGFDSMELGESTGGLELAIRNLINQMYSRDISRKIKSAVDLKKLAGEYAYGAVPYGYKKGEKKNTIVVDNEAAQIVWNIFAWAAEGRTITQIAKRLNDANVTTPSVYLAAVRGKYKTRAFWTFESIRNILHNRIYTGDTVPFKSHVVTVGSKRVKLIPEEQWEIIPDTHEALVSREMYYQARNVVKSNRKSKPTAKPNPLTSFLVCGCCGNKLSKGKAKNKDWLCASARYLSDAECKNVRVNDEALKEVVLHAIQCQCRLMDVNLQRMAGSGKTAMSEREQISAAIGKLRRKIDRTQDKKMRLYERYVNSDLTKENFVREKALATAEETADTKQLALLRAKLSQMTERMELDAVKFESTKLFADRHEITELTAEVMHALIKKIVVYPGDAIHIEWNFSNELAALMESEATLRVGVSA